MCAELNTENFNEEIELKEIFSLLFAKKWLIIVVMIISLVVAWLYTLTIIPKYKTTALMQVDNRSDSNSISGALQSFGQMTSILGQAGSAQPSEVQTALLRSRFILGPTIEKNKLNIIAQAKYFPVFGAFIARHFLGTGLRAPLFGLNKFAWGGEKIHIDQFSVPYTLFNSKLILAARNNQRYKIYDQHGRTILHGQVGKLEQNQALGVKIKVTSLKAHSGTEFYLVRKPNEEVLNTLSNNLTIQDLGDKNITGILSLSLRGENKNQLPGVLNTILDYDVLNNIKQKSAEAEKTLVFLNKQLPLIKKSLDKAEVMLDSYRAKTGSLGISEEGGVLLGQIVTVEQALEKLKMQKLELSQEFTPKHPFILAMDKKQTSLSRELSVLKNQVKRLPITEQRVIALQREVKVKSELYLLLLNKIQQLQMVKAGVVGDVRILNKAVTPPVGIPQHKSLILLGGLFFGFILSIALILFKQMLTRAVVDPDYVEEQLGIPSYAVIPHSKKQEQLFKNIKRKVPGKGPSILAVKNAKDLAIEGLRSLRTTLQFVVPEAKNNIVSIVGATPGIGKSFISLNLSYVLADSGKRVLLIDADLRRGKICQYLAESQAPGLSEILEKKISIDKAKRSVVGGLLDFISCGHYPSNPSELLLRDNFAALLHKLAQQYDLVIIDTPPVLAVTEGVLIAKYAATNLMLVGSGKDTIKELKYATKSLAKNGVTIQGLIFNNTLRSTTQHAYGKNHYYYQYEH